LKHYFPVIGPSSPSSPSIESNDTENPSPPTENSSSNLSFKQRLLNNFHKNDAIVKEARDLITFDPKKKLDPWIQEMNGQEIFDGRRMSPLVEMATVNGNTTVPNGVEHIIYQSVLRLIPTRCVDSIQDLRHREWPRILEFLGSVRETWASEKTKIRFIGKASARRYAGYWAQFLIFCWKWSQLPEERVPKDLKKKPWLQLSPKFTPEQRGRLNEVLEMISSQSIDNSALDQAILDFSMSFIKFGDYDCSGVRSLLIFFCGIRGYNNDDKSWKAPPQHTPFLAGMKYCMRVLSLEHVLPQSQRDQIQQNQKNPPYHSPEDVFCQFYSKWLVKDRATVFAQIVKLLNYGMKIGQNTLKSGTTVTFTEDGKFCEFEGKGRFATEKWVTMVGDVVREMWDLLCDLLFIPPGSILHMNPYSFQDKEGEGENGWNMADGIPDYAGKAVDTIFENLAKSPNADFYVKWKPGSTTRTAEDIDGITDEGLEAYHRIDVAFRERLLLAINYCCGMTGRGTEITPLRFKNRAEAKRNIFIDGGQIMIVTTYHKAQTITRSSDVLTIFLTKTDSLADWSFPSMACIQCSPALSHHRGSIPQHDFSRL
jgi:hypothetical protein